jgi:hypothetical protein
MSRHAFPFHYEHDAWVGGQSLPIMIYSSWHVCHSREGIDPSCQLPSRLGGQKKSALPHNQD